MLWLGGAALMICFFISSCTYHKKELEYPSHAVCDTALVTYSSSIVPLFSANCYKCHSGSAIDGNGVKLDVYPSARAYALFGSMLQMVNHQPGFVPMPKDAAKLSDCNIAIIRKWIEAGAPNN
jgi:hypothetical protein